MSRIQYPKREEIDAQIREILDKSEMFEWEQDDFVTQFTPLRRRHIQVLKFGKAAAGIAVAASVVIFVNRLEIVPQRSASQPMNNIVQDKTQDASKNNRSQEEESPLFASSYEEKSGLEIPYNIQIEERNRRIEEMQSDIDALIQTSGGLAGSIQQINWMLEQNGIHTGNRLDIQNSKDSMPNNALAIGSNVSYTTQKTTKHSTDSVADLRDSFAKYRSYVAEHPYIYHNGILLQNIEEYYTGLDGMTIVGMLRKKLPEVIFEDDTDYQYTIENSYLSAGIYAPNQSVVSIVQGYKESYCTYMRLSSGIGRELGQTIFQNTYIVANNFDIETGDYIQLDNLFTDAQAGKTELFTEVERQIRENYDDSQLSEAYRSGVFDAETGTSVIQDGFNLNNYSWYFSQKGINICCNGLTQNTLAQNSNLSSVTITVPYEKLHYLASEYQP